VSHFTLHYITLQSIHKVTAATVWSGIKNVLHSRHDSLCCVLHSSLRFTAGTTHWADLQLATYTITYL